MHKPGFTRRSNTPTGKFLKTAIELASEMVIELLAFRPHQHQPPLPVQVYRMLREFVVAVCRV
jgi:hypothetical protein